MSVEIRDINHGRDFAPYVTDTCYKVLKGKVVAELQNNSWIQTPDFHNCG